MAKKEIKKFFPKEEQLAHAKFCYENDLAVCVKLVPDTASTFWVEKHLISDYKVMQFLRIDQAKKDTPTNRQVFNEADGLAKCFEMYKIFYEKSKN
jgi:uncharacterized protein involved in tolerance to divalent cations